MNHPQPRPARSAFAHPAYRVRTNPNYKPNPQFGAVDETKHELTRLNGRVYWRKRNSSRQQQSRESKVSLLSTDESLLNESTASTYDSFNKQRDVMLPSRRSVRIIPDPSRQDYRQRDSTDVRGRGARRP